MSVRFETWLIPDADAMRFRPSAEVLGRMFTLLAEQRWISVTSPCEVRDVDTSDEIGTFGFGQLADRCGELLSEDRSFSVELWSNPWPPDGKNVADLDAGADFEKAEDLILLPTHGVSVTPVVSAGLRLVPGDMSGSSIPCPGCGEDLMNAEYEHIGIIAYPAPVHCPHCGIVVAHRELIGRTELSAGDYVEEDAPFFRFGVRLEPAQPPGVTGFATVDPELTGRLASVSGVTFRSMDRWR